MKHRHSTLLDRRALLGGALAASAAAHLGPRANAQRQQAQQDDPFHGAVDTNVSLFHWPFRRLPLDRPSALVAKLRERSIRLAWAGSFEGLLHRDLGAVNHRLAEVCRRGGEGRLIPFGSVNPALPDWEEDLRVCHQQHGMPGIRLHPNYHGYRLDDPQLARLLSLATRRGLTVQVATAMEDTRTQHPQLRVADVDLAPLADVVPRIPGLRLQLLNHKGGAALDEALRLAGVYCDMARVPGTDGVARLLRSAPGRVALGTHAPFLIYEAALIKVYESELTADEAASLVRLAPRELLAKEAR